jgi:hypothetical protein
MFKLTPISSALAALMAATALSGCGGDGAIVSAPTPTGSPIQTTVDATVSEPTPNCLVQTTMDAASKAKTADAKVAYLRIITEFNLANSAYHKVVDQRDSLPTSPPAVPANFRTEAQALSLANTKEVSELRAYGAWPQSVKSCIDQFIAQKVKLADIHHQMSVPAPGWDSWDSGDEQSSAGSEKTADLSGFIRQGLGLPPQPTG